MGFSVDEIGNARFDVSRRGYDAEQVDEFMGKMAEEAKKMAEERANLETQIAKYREMESTLTNVLISAENNAKRLVADAQLRADAMKEDANREALRIKQEAQTQADDYRSQKEQECQDLALQIQELQEFAQSYKQAILEDMDAMRSKLEGENKADAILEQKPETVELFAQQAAAKEVSAEVQPAKDFELGDILKNLPETDGELKAMIDELI